MWLVFWRRCTALTQFLHHTPIFFASFYQFWILSYPHYYKRVYIYDVVFARFSIYEATVKVLTSGRLVSSLHSRPVWLEDETAERKNGVRKKFRDIIRSRFSSALLLETLLFVSRLVPCISYKTSPYTFYVSFFQPLCPANLFPAVPSFL